MLRFVKKLVWLAGVTIGCQSAFGFALIGPPPTGPDNFEVPDIGYLLPGDIGTPKDLFEEYRRNTPVIYYSFDTSFLQYFGPNGAAEVDKAMAMFNSLTNVSSYSSDLTEFPLDSRRVSFRAAADSLEDLKSFTMGLVTEQLGLIEPARWVWALHAREHLTPGPACPGNMEYIVFKRNFDIMQPSLDTFTTSSYVNGVLYSYNIFESCITTPEPEADAVEFPVDPLSSPYSAVRDFVSFWYVGLQPGAFYTTFTRDDVAGLRYLLATNNINLETTGLRTTEFFTNDTPAVITTFDLSLFATQARTNPPAALLVLYPGLIITSSTNFPISLAITTNITEILVNKPLDPAGAPPSHPLFSTNYTTNVVTLFQNTYGNLVTNTFATQGLVGTVTFGLTNSPFSPAGTPPTITTNVKPAFVKGVFGDAFLLPTNLCGAQILSNLLTTVVATTNLPTLIATTVSNAVTFIPGSVTFFTNHAVVYLPVSCPVDSTGNFGGVERIQFVRRDYDAIISQTWDPVTNDYVLPEFVTDTKSIVLRHMQRRVPRPDFLFSAADLNSATSISYTNTVDGVPETFTFALTGFIAAFDVRSINFRSVNIQHLAGPGTIEGPLVLPTLLIFNKLAPLFLNGTANLSTNSFIVADETTQIPIVGWGSFDGTTNAPTVYPNGTSIAALEALLTGPSATTRLLPNASIGADYTAQLAAIGGQAPYTWSLAPGSPGLPDGLSLSSDGQITGNPNGPASIYDFTVRVTDSLGAFSDTAYTITVF